MGKRVYKSTSERAWHRHLKREAPQIINHWRPQRPLRPLRTWPHWPSHRHCLGRRSRELQEQVRNAVLQSKLG